MDLGEKIAPPPKKVLRIRKTSVLAQERYCGGWRLYSAVKEEARVQKEQK